MSRLHWIDLPIAGRLAIAARPRAEDWLADDIAAWVGRGHRRRRQPAGAG
ncbi:MULTISPECIES: hypothetical protein [unclassified Bradyrhizobium]|nr:MULTISPECIES: hypothetical protein [unclassified Bradyrhizobium]